jgi:pyruvate/2-oxoglutarate dehydrogenase complex dihydrolipoamide dehydrogenase (E3) component
VSHKNATYTVEYADGQGTKAVEAEQLLVATGMKVALPIRK